MLTHSHISCRPIPPAPSTVRLSLSADRSARPCSCSPKRARPGRCMRPSHRTSLWPPMRSRSMPHTSAYCLSPHTLCLPICSLQKAYDRYQAELEELEENSDSDSFIHPHDALGEAEGHEVVLALIKYLDYEVFRGAMAFDEQAFRINVFGDVTVRNIMCRYYLQAKMHRPNSSLAPNASPLKHRPTPAPCTHKQKWADSQIRKSCQRCFVPCLAPT